MKKELRGDRRESLAPVLRPTASETHGVLHLATVSSGHKGASIVFGQKLYLICAISVYCRCGRRLRR
jgi:hypothetical protein